MCLEMRLDWTVMCTSLTHADTKVPAKVKNAKVFDNEQFLIKIVGFNIKISFKKTFFLT